MQAFRTLPLAMLLCLPACVFAQERPPADLPEAPKNQNGASVSGTIEDQNGSLLPGAHVELQSDHDTVMETADDEGEFHAEGLPAGTYTVRVVADGFDGENETIDLQEHEQRALSPIELKMTGNAASVVVTASVHDIAMAQVAEEEKQRVLGIIPNFYVVYHANPAPLTAKQKFHLAWRSTLDPISFLGVGVSAGLEQAENEFPGYGQGADGYAKRYGAGFADSAIAGFLGGAIYPSIFHQDPRYYYQGTGTFASRARHAIQSVVICRGDNGKMEFNVSNVLGNFSAAGLSNLYYPASDRHGAGLTMQNAAIGTAFGAFAALMQEFVVPKLTPHLKSRLPKDND